MQFMHFARTYYGIGLLPIIAIITAFGMQAARNDKLKSTSWDLEKASSDYEALAETARRYRIVDADTTTTRQDLKNTVDALDNRRSKLDDRSRAEPVRVQALKTRYRVEALTDDPLEADLQEFDKELIPGAESPHRLSFYCRPWVEAHADNRRTSALPLP